MDRTQLLVAVVVIAITMFALPATAAGDTVESAQATPINDGPYLYRHDDSTIITMHICDGTLVMDTTPSVAGEFRVPGLCSDSGVVYLVPADGFRTKPHQYSGVPKVFAVSDIHGEYEYLVDILRNGGVVDAERHWTWGDGHLVIVGDVFGRGDMVTECLWLLYNLEQEASVAGGEVHVLLGNHEKMVLRGDNRYLHDKYLNGIGAMTRIDPKDLYGPNTVLGQWLRTKNTVIEIDDVVYIHAGISPTFADSGYTMSTINEVVRDKLDISSLQYRFDDLARTMYGSTGPLWYRGFWQASDGRYEKATDADVTRILSFYDASSMVVGHTNMDSVMSHYGGMVFAIDVLFEDLRSLQALLWQDGFFYRVAGDGTQQRLK
jgi:hypothetical protein